MPQHPLEGCRELTMPVLQNPCVYCQGFGARPIHFDPRCTQTEPLKCDYCNGSGKRNDSRGDQE